MSESEFTAGAQDGAPKPLEVLSAFTVVVDHSGRAWAVRDAAIPGVSAALRADSHIIKAACIQLADEIRSAEVATQTAELVALTLAPTPPSDELQRERLRQRVGLSKEALDA